MGWYQRRVHGELSTDSYKMKVLIALACVIAATSALPYILVDDGEPQHRVRRQLEPQGFKRPILKRQDQFGDRYEDDLESAADNAYGAPPVGRVKIQAYRGPSKGEGYDVFAPWGYYNTQPADLANHHQHHHKLISLTDINLDLMMQFRPIT